MIKKEKNNSFILSLLPLLSVIVVVGFALLRNQDTIHIVKLLIITLLLTATIVFFVNMQGNQHITEKKYWDIIIVSLYLISLLLVMQPYYPEVFTFWMIGPLLIAMIIDSKLGLLTCLNMVILLSINSSLGLEKIIHLLIVGLLIIILSKYLKQQSSVVYASIIILSTDITLAFVINNFIFDSTYSYINSLISLIIILVVSYILYTVYVSLVKNDKIKSKDVSPTPYQRENRTSYVVLLDDDNELWKKIKLHSNTLYEHSKLIGDISERAANAIGAETLICKAGGRFHEVGKINEGNYIEENLRIAEEYSFPEGLKNILKEHNIKHDKPTSVESAIVMLSDHIVSTLHYIDKTKKDKYSKAKIIDQLFQTRINKGTFDKTGMLVKDYGKLKDFFIEEFQEDS